MNAFFAVLLLLHIFPQYFNFSILHVQYKQENNSNIIFFLHQSKNNKSYKCRIQSIL